MLAANKISQHQSHPVVLCTERNALQLKPLPRCHRDRRRKRVQPAFATSAISSSTQHAPHLSHFQSPEPPVSQTETLPLQPVLGHSPEFLADETGRNPLAGPEHLPLQGKRVLVTAPRQYASKLCSKLLSAGSRPLWIPGVAINALNTTHHAREVSALDHALSSLVQGGHGYTHIAFTSKNGIHAVLQRLAHITGEGLDGACRVLHESGAALCALGADGAVLTQAGLAVHVSPREASTQGLVKELQARGEVQGARVLCPVPLVTGGLTEPAVVPRFLAALEASGASAVRLAAYETALGASPRDCEAEKQMLVEGHVAAIAFSSTAEAQGLVHLVGLECLTSAVLRHGVLLAAHGPYTAQGASQVLGLPVPCVSKAFGTFDGLVVALETHFAAETVGHHVGSTAQPAAETAEHSFGDQRRELIRAL